MTGTWKALPAVCMLLTAVAFATPDATLSGRIQNSAGKPQMGVVVEVYSTDALPVARAYTDAKGAYQIADIVPGRYFLKASADQFLPSVREGIVLKAGSHLLVNLTLTTLIEAFQFLPAQKADVKSEDDWRWTLRSAANRPILRVLEHDGLVVVSHEQKKDTPMKAVLAFSAGSNGDSVNAADATTTFALERSLFGSGIMSFSGNVGSFDGPTSGAIRASYKHALPNGSEPQVALTVRRFATSDLLTHHAGVNALSLGLSDHVALSNFLEAEYGGELQSIQFRGRAVAFKPFATFTGHLSDDTTVQYIFTTSRPNTRAELGMSSIMTDLSQSDPRVALYEGDAKIERASHHELAVSHRVGATNFQVATYTDRLRNPSLVGVGEVSINDDDVSAASFLPDVISNTFNYMGSNYSASGVRVVAQRKWNNAFTTTVDYSFGGALLANSANGIPAFQTSNLSSATGKISGDIPSTGTHWLASYKWTSSPNVVSAVDLFNNSAGRSDPYLNVFVRQRLPIGSFIPAKMEALVDVRNLLAQGYVPFVSPDGHTLYLVQSARSLRGGVAFSF
jgi:hypothetical protein